MKQKRDENGKFVKMYLTRDEYDAKVAELEKTIDSLAKAGQEAKNEAAFWKQEYETKGRLYREQEIQFKKIAAMRNWLYDHAGCITKMRYNKAKQDGEL